MIRDLKEDTNKHKDEIRKSIQDLDKKVSIMEEKFNKEMEIMKNNQVEMLRIKQQLNQVQTRMDSSISRQDQTEERKRNGGQY
jgi:hypothetical protein